ncbi:ethylene responsive transcription factor 1b, partial [Trifolium medium]|nr:ethylene responsive transcription factor 1b [Trifolium medium]
NFKAVELHVDSTIVVLAICSTGSGSMCGRSLVEKIRRLFHLDREVVVRHSYHEANQCADALANLGCLRGYD